MNPHDFAQGLSALLTSEPVLFSRLVDKATKSKTTPYGVVMALIKRFDVAIDSPADKVFKRVLQAIGPEPLDIQTICSETALTNSHVRSVVKALTKKGYVTTAYEPIMRRNRLTVTITDAGRAIVAQPTYDAP